MSPRGQVACGVLEGIGLWLAFAVPGWATAPRSATPSRYKVSPLGLIVISNIRSTVIIALLIIIIIVIIIALSSSSSLSSIVSAVACSRVP